MGRQKGINIKEEATPRGTLSHGKLRHRVLWITCTDVLRDTCTYYTHGANNDIPIIWRPRTKSYEVHVINYPRIKRVMTYV